MMNIITIWSFNIGEKLIIIYRGKLMVITLYIIYIHIEYNGVVDISYHIDWDISLILDWNMITIDDSRGCHIE